MADPNMEAAREYYRARETGRYERREQARQQWQTRVRHAYSVKLEPQRLRLVMDQALA
jgi:hypothetical protein